MKFFNYFAWAFSQSSQSNEHGGSNSHLHFPAQPWKISHFSEKRKIALDLLDLNLLRTRYLSYVPFKSSIAMATKSQNRCMKFLYSLTHDVPCVSFDHFVLDVSYLRPQNIYRIFGWKNAKGKLISFRKFSYRSTGAKIFRSRNDLFCCLR